MKYDEKSKGNKCHCWTAEKKLRGRSKYYLSTTSGSGSSGGAFLDGASYSGLLGREMMLAGRRSAGLLGRRSTVRDRRRSDAIVVVIVVVVVVVVIIM